MPIPLPGCIAFISPGSSNHLRRFSSVRSCTAPANSCRLARWVRSGPMPGARWPSPCHLWWHEAQLVSNTSAPSAASVPGSGLGAGCD